MGISEHLARISPSATLLITQAARTLREEGVDVIGLSAGEPDFDTPDNIKLAAQKAINLGHTKYTNVDGMPALKRAICHKFKRDNTLDYAPSQINVSPGGKAVIYNALLASLNPADEVIIPAPCWVSYPDMVKLAGGIPVIAASSPNENFILKPESLEKAITTKTKWLFLNSPSNPTGAVYSQTDMAALADVLRAYPNIMILCDDIYEHLVYDGHEFATLAQVAPDLFDRILTVNGVSKAYAMTGWRIGYAGGPEWLIKGMAKVMGQTTSNAASISQYAAMEALNGPQGFIAKRNDIYKARRDIVHRRINAISGISCSLPLGAFYIFVQCSDIIGKRSPKGKIIETDVDFASCLLDEAHVAVVPGAAFQASPNFRISYSVDTPSLELACERIKDFCTSLS